ncbi:MAG: hypothetical protein ACHQAX_05315 [Gammaproteobacteria bacterium]
MYMFPFHAAYALYLLTVVASTALYVWGLNTDKKGRYLAKLMGAITLFLSILGILCNAYFGIHFWQNGCANSPMSMQCMMGKMDMKAGMPMDMQKMMGDHADMQKK